MPVIAYLSVVVCVAIALAVVLLVTARRRWGHDRIRDVVGEGAYRAGVLVRDVPRPVPGSVAAATIAAAVWGALTLFVLVPGAGLIALLSLETIHNPRAGIFVMYGFLLSILVVASIAHATELFVVARELSRHRPGATVRARAAARRGRWHSVAVVLVLPMPVFFVGIVFWLIAVAVLVAPAALGFWVAKLVHRAALDVDELDELEVAQERIATGSPTAISTSS